MSNPGLQHGKAIFIYGNKWRPARRNAALEVATRVFGVNILCGAIREYGLHMPDATGLRLQSAAILRAAAF